jgi:photosystem I P700 chlorophyll a apoprotein A2
MRGSQPTTTTRGVLLPALTLSLVLVTGAAACGSGSNGSEGDQAERASARGAAATTTTTAPPTTAPTTTATPDTIPIPPPEADPLDLGEIDVAAEGGQITISTPEGARQMTESDAVAELGGEVTEKGIEVALPDTVLFDFGSAALRRDAREQLSLIAGLAASHPEAAVTIGGHADAIGESAANQALSEDRASAVAAALQTLGVDGDRMTATGFGESRPVAPNTNPDGSDNAEGRQRNRRVEVLVVGADVQQPTR